MIVRVEGNRLAIFRQADHAHLSGRLAAAWGRPPWDPVAPFPSVAVAARQHDDAWVAYDEAPEFRDGRPLSFFEVDRVRTTAMYSTGINALSAIDAYAGLLVSLHYSGFFTSHWGWQPFSTPDRFAEPEAGALRAFLVEERNRQEQLRSQLRLGPADEPVIAANYKWLQLWDRVSLDICRQPGEEPWVIEYPSVPAAYGDDTAVQLKLGMVAPGQYTLQPYPLLPPHFGAVIPVTRVSAAHRSARTFLEEWRSAEVEAVRISISGAAAAPARAR